MSAAIHTLPRSQRDYMRGKIAAEAVKAAGGDVTAQWKRHLAVTFDRSSIHNSRKMRVERYIRLGAGHPECRARFGADVAMLRDRQLRLRASCIVIGTAHKIALAQFRQASRLGTRISSQHVRLGELALILRWMRRQRMHADFDHLLRLATGDEFALEAAE